MSYETLEKEIQAFKTLPEEYIAELGDFITYLKLKAKFMEHAFDSIRSKEVYKTKEIW